MGYQIGNIYGITAIAVIGGGLFGFDISSMSAMYVEPSSRPNGLVLIFTAFQHNSTAATLTRDPRALPSQAPKMTALVLPPMYKEASLQRESSLSTCLTNSATNFT
jgi:hypothetical protein